MSRNRLRIIAWAAAVVVIAAGGVYAYRLDLRHRILLECMEHAHHCEHGENFEGAVGIYRRALEADPKYLPARIALADVYTAQGKHKEALAELRRAVELDPRNPEAHVARATYLMGDKSHREAAECLRAGIEAAPRHVYMRLLLASCLRRTGQADQARRELLEIEKISPGLPAVRNALRALEGETHSSADARPSA